MSIRSWEANILVFSNARARSNDTISRTSPGSPRGAKDRFFFHCGQLNRRRLQIGVGPLPRDFIRSALPSGIANCGGNDGPYRTAPKGVHPAVYVRERLNICEYPRDLYIDAPVCPWKAGHVNTTPVPKRNIDHVNVVSRLSRIHAVGTFRSARFQLIKHRGTEKKCWKKKERNLRWPLVH